MKKKVITVSAIIAGILIIGWFGVCVLLPRLVLYKTVKDFLPSLDKKIEYFADFSILKNDVQTIDNGYISLKIPSDYAHDTRKLELLPYVYRSTDNEELVMLLKESSDLSKLNMLDPEYFENMEDVPKDMGIKELTDGFEKIGNGLPNSAYNTYKCALLTERDDYSFWDIKKSVCFSIVAVYKKIITSNYDEIYLYEKDDKRGIIFIKHPHDDTKTETVTVELFSADDLNTSYSIIIGTKSVEDAFAVINSAEFI